MSTLIVTGGFLDIPVLTEYLSGKRFSHVIAVDGAAEKIRELGVWPDYLVGDFDTLSPEILYQYEKESGVQIRSFQPEKDDTDTELAIRMAIGFEKELSEPEVLLFGMTGTRMDHTLANLFLMERFATEGIPAYSVDANNRISIHKSPFRISKKEQYGSYVSFLALNEAVDGLTLEGFRYPLKNAKLMQNTSLCISNEIVSETARVSFADGLLMMVESKDG